MVYTHETVIGIASEHGATEYSILILTTEGLGHPQLGVRVRTLGARVARAGGVAPTHDRTDREHERR